MTDPRFHIVLNPNAGTCLTLGLTAATLQERLDAAGLVATIDADCDDTLAERITRAVESDAEIIVAAGGDGTVTALAAAMVGTDKTLATLPLGTANLLARDLHLPLDLDAALASLRDLVPKRIDVAEVNGRVFLHNVTLGFLTDVAERREQMRGHTGITHKIGFLRYFLKSLASARRMAVEITPDGQPPRVSRAHAVTIANNAYDEGFGQVFSRQRLDGGHLGLYTVKHLNLGDVVRLSLSMVLGRWQQEEAVDVETVGEVTIRTKARFIDAMIDGEVETLRGPLEFRIRPLALSVLAPAVVDPETVVPDQDEFAVGI